MSDKDKFEELVSELKRRYRIAKQNFALGLSVSSGSINTLHELIDFADELNKKPDVEEISASDDVDVAASEYVSNPDNFVDWIGHNGETDDIRYIIKAFKTGSAWKSDQSLKDALPGEVVKLTNFRGEYSYLAVDAQLPEDTELKSGDKVKVLIIKEK